MNKIKLNFGPPEPESQELSFPVFEEVKKEEIVEEVVEEIKPQLIEDFDDVLPKKKKKKQKEKKEKIKKKKTKKTKSKKAKVGDVEKSDLDLSIEKEYRKTKIKKTIIASSLALIFLSNIVFGFYNAFFKKERPLNELAYFVNEYNGTTAFPTDGILGFLQFNINNLMKTRVSFGKGVKEFGVKPENIYITRVVKKTNTLVNVYFDAIVDTNLGSTMHSFILPLKYKWDTYSYHPAGELSIKIAQSNSNLEQEENELLSFDGLTKASDINLKSAESFLTNFFTIVYNTKGDYTQDYLGSYKLGDDNVKFDSISSLELYNSKNRGGYNACVSYYLVSEEGLRYTVSSYLDLESINVGVGNIKWVINSIL